MIDASEEQLARWRGPGEMQKELAEKSSYEAHPINGEHDPVGALPARIKRNTVPTTATRADTNASIH